MLHRAWAPARPYLFLTLRPVKMEIGKLAQLGPRKYGFGQVIETGTSNYNFSANDLLDYRRLYAIEVYGASQLEASIDGNTPVTDAFVNSCFLNLQTIQADRIIQNAPLSGMVPENRNGNLYTFPGLLIDWKTSFFVCPVPATVTANNGNEIWFVFHVSAWQVTEADRDQRGNYPVIDPAFGSDPFCK